MPVGSDMAFPMAKERKDIELHPDAWPRFERFIEQIAKVESQGAEEKAIKNRKKPKP
jgi:hypothetical protein